MSSRTPTPENKSGTLLFSKELIFDELPMGGGWVGVIGYCPSECSGTAYDGRFPASRCPSRANDPPHPGTQWAPSNSVSSHTHIPRGERGTSGSARSSDRLRPFPLHDGGGRLQPSCRFHLPRTASPPADVDWFVRSACLAGFVHHSQRNSRNPRVVAGRRIGECVFDDHPLDLGKQPQPAIVPVTRHRFPLL